MEKFVGYVRKANTWSLLLWMVCWIEFMWSVGDRFQPQGEGYFLAVFVFFLPFVALGWERISRGRASWIHALAWSMWCFAWLGMISASLVSSLLAGFSLGWAGPLGMAVFFNYFFFFAIAMLIPNLVVNGWSWWRAMRSLGNKVVVQGP